MMTANHHSTDTDKTTQHRNIHKTQ